MIFTSGSLSQSLCFGFDLAFATSPASWAGVNTTLNMSWEVEARSVPVLLQGAGEADLPLSQGQWGWHQGLWGGRAAGTFGHGPGAECPQAQWASSGGLLPPWAILPHLLQGNRLILSRGLQGELLFISGGMGRGKCFSWACGVWKGVGIGPEGRSLWGQIRVSPTECPREAPGPAPSLDTSGSSIHSTQLTFIIASH